NPGKGIRSSHSKSGNSVIRLEKCLNTGLCAAEDERMNIMRSLVGVHRLQVLSVAHDAVAYLDAVAAMHVARHACDIEGLAAVVALDDRDHLGRIGVSLHQAADLDRKSTRLNSSH